MFLLPSILCRICSETRLQMGLLLVCNQSHRSLGQKLWPWIILIGDTSQLCNHSFDSTSLIPLQNSVLCRVQGSWQSNLLSKLDSFPQFFCCIANPLVCFLDSLSDPASWKKPLWLNYSSPFNLPEV
jgi:hypothetical protein